MLILNQVPNVYSSAALETTSLVTGTSAVNGGAKLLGLLAENTSNATGWIQLHNGHAAPTNGAVPIVSIKAATVTQVSLDLAGVNCLPFSDGIVVALSSTGPTYTAVATSMFVSCFWI